MHKRPCVQAHTTASLPGPRLLCIIGAGLAVGSPPTTQGWVSDLALDVAGAGKALGRAVFTEKSPIFRKECVNTPLVPSTPCTRLQALGTGFISQPPGVSGAGSGGRCCPTTAAGYGMWPTVVRRSQIRAEDGAFF